MSGDEIDPYSLPGGAMARQLDDLGPGEVLGISRYPSYPDSQDFSGPDVIIDALREAIGRYVTTCALLEIAIFQARAGLDPDMTFARAERERRPGQCIEDLRAIADQLQQRSRVKLKGLLDEAQTYVRIRNAVVHGVYRRNHLREVYESRRYVRNKKTKEFELERVQYDRNSLMLAMTRANNVAADLLDGLNGWAAQLGLPQRSPL